MIEQMLDWTAPSPRRIRSSAVPYKRDPFAVPITILARRIVIEHNRMFVHAKFAATGGFMVFDYSGNLLYTNVRDTFTPEPATLMIPRRDHRVTIKEILALIEARG